MLAPTNNAQANLEPALEPPGERNKEFASVHEGRETSCAERDL